MRRTAKPPGIYEIKTRPWLAGGRGGVGKTGHRGGGAGGDWGEGGLPGGDTGWVGQVPAEIWDEVALPGIDTVWLMGVWERSPAGIAVARANESLQREFAAVLPDLAPDDLVGSPYCVRRYRVDERLGGPSGLAAA